MPAALVESIKRRAAAEAERTAHPPGFPALPPVPARRYCDPDFAALEDDGVWGRSWLMVAHVDEVPEPGSYRRLDQLGPSRPVLLVRGHDGVIRAFFNTCKHRGAELVAEATGTVGRRLACPYHNWVYALDGELVGTPGTHDFVELGRECLALTAIRCETWGPLVFVNLSGDARPLGDELGQVANDLDELAGLAGKLHLVDRTERDVPVNWKVPVDANIETYHVNYVHKETAARVLQQSATGIQLLANGHSRMLIRAQDGVDLGASPLPGLFDGVGDLPTAGTFSYHVFPNLSIVFGGPGFVFFITNWPTGPSSSSYLVHWCASVPAGDPEHGAFLDWFVGLNRNVLFEDLTVLPGIQRSIDAGTLDSLRLGYQERRIHHLHEAIDRAIGPDRIAEGLRVAQILGPHVEA